MHMNRGLAFVPSTRGTFIPWPIWICSELEQQQLLSYGSIRCRIVFKPIFLHKIIHILADISISLPSIYFPRNTIYVTHQHLEWDTPKVRFPSHSSYRSVTTCYFVWITWSSACQWPTNQCTRQSLTAMCKTHTTMNNIWMGAIWNIHTNKLYRNLLYR